jgi:hypothetical protein
MAFLLAVALAIVFAIAAYWYWSVLMGLAGALLGYGLAAGVGIFLKPDAPAFALLVGLAGAAIGLLVFVAAKDLMVMVTSALNGAMIVGGAAQTWLVPGSPLKESLALVVFVAVAAIGVAVQVRLFGKQRKYSTGRAGPPVGHSGAS